MSNENIRPIDAAIAQLKLTHAGGGGRESEDVDDQPLQTTEALEENSVPPAEELFWPPPGLEKLHGELPRLAGDFAMASALLVAVLVYGALEDGSWTGGWGVVVALMIDFVLLASAYSRLRQLLLHAQDGITRGYPRPMVWHVAADSHRDLPLMLQSKGLYADQSKEQAASLARLRTTSAALMLLGTIWLPLSFPLLAVIGSTGIVSRAILWIALLVPAIIMLIAGAVLRLREINTKRPLRVREAVEHETSAQVAAWSQLYSRLGVQRMRSKNTLELKLAMAGIWIAAFVLLVPIALAAITTVVPRFAVGSMGGFPAPARLESMVGLKPLRLPADSSVTPVAAGRALHNLGFIGRQRDMSPLLQPVTKAYPEPVYVSGARLEAGAAPGFWPDSIFVQIRRGLPAEQRENVVRAANHPANADLSTLARAARMDVAGTRWHLQLADSIELAALPFGRFMSVRDAANAHIALAALQLERGDQAAAEKSIKEVITVGFLLRDDALTLIDALTGSSVLRSGAAALSAFYQATGRPAEAMRIQGQIIAHDAINYRSQSRGVHPTLRDMQRYVLDRSMSRGARWEMFAMIQTIAPCSNLQRAIFGPSQNDARWLDDARKALVREEGDKLYFEQLKRGMIAKSKQEGERCSPQVLRGYRRMVMGY